MHKAPTIAICLLVLAMSGCVAKVLENPADPAWDSVQIAHAYSVQSDMMLLVPLLILVVFAGAVKVLVSQMIKNRR